MISQLRLRGRALQINNLSESILLFLSRGALLIALCLLQLLLSRISQTAEIYFSVDVRKVMNLFFSLMLPTVIFLAMSLMNEGIRRFFLRRAGGLKAGSEDIFFYFRRKRLSSAIRFSLGLRTVKLAAAFFLYLPSAVTLLLIFLYLREGTSVRYLFALAASEIMFFINGSFFYFRLSNLLFLCPYFFASGEYKGLKRIITDSAEIMKSKRRVLTRLRLSFWGWFLTCLTVLPVGYVWSYYNQTLAVAAKDFMKRE